MRLSAAILLAALLVTPAAAAPPSQQKPVAPPAAQAERPPGAAVPLAGLVRVTVTWPTSSCGRATSPDPCRLVQVALRPWPPTGPAVERQGRAKPGAANGECMAQFEGNGKNQAFKAGAHYQGAWADAPNCSECTVEGWVALETNTFPKDVTVPLVVRNAISPTQVCPAGARLQ